LGTLTLAAGSSYPITLTPGFSGGSYNEYFKVWIDYNANGTFDEPMELAFDAGSGSQNAVNGTILVPISSAIVPGSTRMRVGMSYVGIFGAGGPPSSCGTYAYGEVEDYCFNLELVDGFQTIENNFSFNAFPNPANETVNFVLPSNIQKFQLRVYSSEGKCVKQITTDSRSFSVSELATGWYVFEVLTESRSARTKICVE
jgi:hypothetical protein